MIEFIGGIVTGALGLMVWQTLNTPHVPPDAFPQVRRRKPQKPPTREELDELREMVNMCERGVENKARAVEFWIEQGLSGFHIKHECELLAEARQRLKDAQDKLNRRTAEYEAPMLEKGHE